MAGAKTILGEVKKSLGKPIKVEVRLPDGGDLTMELRQLVGPDILAVRRVLLESNAKLQQRVRDNPSEEEDDPAARLMAITEEDDALYRYMLRMAVVWGQDDSTITDEDLDKVVAATGGKESDFARAVYKACGMTHPLDQAAQKRRNLGDDLHFLLQGKRGATRGK